MLYQPPKTFVLMRMYCVGMRNYRASDSLYLFIFYFCKGPFRGSILLIINIDVKITNMKLNVLI